MADTLRAITRATRWSDELAYTYPLQRCLCYGRQPSVLQHVNAHGTRAPLDAAGARTHSVWVGFLDYNNDEYERERSMRDYFFLPMNWLTVKLTGRSFIHCQLYFWDELRKQYYTFSVNDRMPVYVEHKTHFRKGWRFVRLGVTEQQEVLVHNFCVAQLGKELNTAGQHWLLISPVSGGGRTWFCSELATAALEAAGLIDYGAWPGVTCAAGAAMHHLFDYLTKHCITCPTELLAGNPISVAELHKAAVSRGKIALTNELPASVVSHATNSTTPLLSNDLAEQLVAMPVLRPQISLDHYVVKR